MKRTGNWMSILLLIVWLPTIPAVAGDGRKRISSMAQSSGEAEAIEAEILFGRELAARILGAYGLDEDTELNRYVNLVGRATALHSGRPELIYYFGVLASDDINAYAAPGGYVFITRGALLKMANEAQLAGVLGHEIAHITERHVIRELNIKGEDRSAVAGIAGLIGGATGGAVKSLEQAMDRAADILFREGYKVTDEIEADRIGMLMAASAGYDPAALKQFLTEAGRFEVEDRNYQGDYPLHRVRFAAMDAVLTAGGLAQMKNATVAERFHENVIH
ncbi:MAG: M48 family metalloprotease [Thermodesulfobacteriota bacterium]